MSLGWLKHYMPRGLYGRAALILVLPVLVLLTIVSVTFIQRHLEDVTTQMTQTVVRELQLALGTMAGKEDKTAALEAVAPVTRVLQMQVGFVDAEAVPDGDSRLFYDYSGIVLTAQLRDQFPNLLAVRLPEAPSVAL